MSGTAKSIGVCICVVAWLTAGCDRWSANPRNEVQEANFIEGNNFRIQGQTNRAIQSFERALHVNPSSAQAHMAVADLYFGTGDYTSAAYHYSRYGRLVAERGGKPDASIQSSIEGCELQLAVKYSDKLGRQQTDARLDELRQKLVEREDALEKLSQELARVRAGMNPSAESQSQSQSQPPAPAATTTEPPVAAATPASPTRARNAIPESTQPPVTANSRPEPTKPTARVVPAPTTPQGSSGVPARSASRSRPYTVRAGDTPAAIARRAGVSTKSLMAANPGLNPSRLRPGQIIRVPSP